MTLRQSQVNVSASNEAKSGQYVTIRGFAKLCRTTPRTIRFYDQKGLLKPAFIDEWNKYRYYSPLQMREYFKIKLLHSYQIPLKDIGISLKKNQSRFLDKRLTDLKNSMEEEQRQLNFLQTMRKVMFEKGDLNKTLKREVIGPYTLLVKYVEHGQYDGINADIKEVNVLAEKLGIPITGTKVVFYLNLVGYQPKDTRLEVCVVVKSVPKGIKLPQNYSFRKFPRTAFKVFNYEGPFEYITLIYQRFHQHRKNRALRYDELGFDIHERGWWNEKSEYKFLTKICFKV